MAEAQAAESTVHVHDGVKSHDHHGNHNHDAQSNPSHNHSQCDHDMVLGALTNNNAVDFFTKHFEILKFQQKQAFAKTQFNALAPVLVFPPLLDHSPPYSKFSSTPLYLANSVLLI